MNINRNDMLELTRRMNVARSSFTRIAGAYMDSEGFVDDTFNVNFLKLSAEEKGKNIEIAKSIPFASTNEKLTRHKLADNRNMYQLLAAIKSCALKNDALMLNLYEIIGENYKAGRDYAIYVFHDRYDVPRKASDKERLGESEEMFEYIIGAICPLEGDYEPGHPEAGFIFPAFWDRSAAIEYMDIFGETEYKVGMMKKILLGE